MFGAGRRAGGGGKKHGEIREWEPLAGLSYRMSSTAATTAIPKTEVGLEEI